MDNKKYPERWFLNSLSIPIIYGAIVPLIIFDIYLEIYHQICFRLYGIPVIKRKNYIKIDRHKLNYLPWYDKINCAYCGYGNGLINYASEILAKTEKFWCGIKHAKDPNFKIPQHHQDFLEYGDEDVFKKVSRSERI